jgi:hypothetical protein
VKRYEEAFQQLGLEFYKTRAARLFLQKMATEPDSLMSNDTGDRFEKLFKIVGERFDKLKANGFKFG